MVGTVRQEHASALTKTQLGTRRVTVGELGEENLHQKLQSLIQGCLVTPGSFSW